MTVAVTTRCIIIMELVSVGKNREITQLGKMHQGSGMINALYSSNYGTAPTSSHAAAKISPGGVQREMYHLCVCVLLQLNRCLKNGATQLGKDAYISMTLVLRLLGGVTIVFVPLLQNQYITILLATNTANL